MSTALIVSIVAILLVLFGLGYLWLIRARKTAGYSNYIKVSEMAARDFRRDEQWDRRHDR